MDFNPPSARSLLSVLVAAGAGYLLYVLSPILTPFLIAAIVAYICDPLVDRLERRRWSRTLGTVLVLLALLLVFVILVAVLIPLAQAQTRLMMQQLPALLDWGRGTLLPWLQANLGIDIAQDQGALIDWAKAHLAELGQLTAYLPNLKDSGLMLLGLVSNLLLIPLVTFYLLRDWDDIVAKTAEWIPPGMRAKIETIAREVDAVLSEFIRGQLSVIALMVLFYAIGLWLAGLDYALAVGLVAGVLVFVPYLGVVVGVILGSLAALAQGADFYGLLPIWGVFAAGQLLEGMVVTPWLVGDRVGLHPVAVIFALMAFGQLFGFFGVLLAIPASAALLVALRHLKPETPTAPSSEQPPAST
jgi:predicted PurR-regulated permease PerM